MLRLIAFLMLIPTLSLAGPAEDIAAVNSQSKGAYDYYCTDASGERFELGEVVCLNNNSCSPSWLAKCDMSLNNPMWRKVQDGCPAATLLQRFQRIEPGLYSLPVGPEIINPKS